MFEHFKKNIYLYIIFSLIISGLWMSEDFKNISTGVAIFMFGMIMLEDGFEYFADSILKDILHKLTNNMFKSISFGAISTAIVQSSSLVSVLTISFLGTGLLTLKQGVGVIFGANLGTTSGAWLISIFGLKMDVGSFAMSFIVFGVIFLFHKNKDKKSIGYILCGLGLLFFGIKNMKESFVVFSGLTDLSSYHYSGVLGLIMFTLVGVLATVIMQSSHATLMLTLTALASNQITYQIAIALAIGSNIGTTITAILGALSSNNAGKQLALAHLLFNITTGLFAIVFINQFIGLTDFVSDSLHIKDLTLKLSVFHAMFNVAGIIIMIPLTKYLIRFLEIVFPNPDTNTEKIEKTLKNIIS